MQVYRKRNSMGRNQTTFITRLIKDESPNKSTLEQIEGIFECIEKLSLYKDLSNPLTEMVKCILEDSQEQGQ